jgi:hypothetical protein
MDYENGGDMIKYIGIEKENGDQVESNSIFNCASNGRVYLMLYIPNVCEEWVEVDRETLVCKRDTHCPSVLPTDAQERKDTPVYSGVVKYFPRAMCALARLSNKGNGQHNPGKPLHWDRSKSGDELDALMRHLIEEDWVAVAWRAMANLEKHLEEAE